MARYQAGDLVAFVNKFQRCGRIVRMDNKGYKVDTGYDIIYAYENEIVLISSNAPIRSGAVINKIDKVSSGISRYNSAFREALISLISEHSWVAEVFCSYVMNVSDKAVKSCIEAISNIRIEKVEINFIKIEIKGAIVEKLIPQGDQ
jgi:hypothetical protein